MVKVYIIRRKHSENLYTVNFSTFTVMCVCNVHGTKLSCIDILSVCVYIQCILSYWCTCIIEKKKKKAIIADLKAKGYDSDPVKAWKKSLEANGQEGDKSDNDNEESSDDGGMDYNYLYTMSLLSLSLEKVEELLKHKQKKVKTEQ